MKSQSIPNLFNIFRLSLQYFTRKNSLHRCLIKWAQTYKSIWTCLCKTIYLIWKVSKLFRRSFTLHLIPFLSFKKVFWQFFKPLSIYYYPTICHLHRLRWRAPYRSCSLPTLCRNPLLHSNTPSILHILLRLALFRMCLLVNNFLLHFGLNLLTTC